MFDKRELQVQMLRNDVSMTDLANYIGVNIATLSRKMNGISDFTRNEIQLIKTKLNLSAQDVERIFFAHKLA